MNRNLYHSGNLIARNRISLKARILHQKVSIFQFVFIRRIASSPNESVRSISYLSLKGHKHRFHPVIFLFFWKYTQEKVLKAFFTNATWCTFDLLIRDDEKGIVGWWRGTTRIDPVYSPKLPLEWKMKTKRSWFPNQARNYVCRNCLIV